MGKIEYEETILSNMDEVKNWDHRVLFVTATDIAWNYLTGQDFSFPFPVIMKFFLWKNFVPPENDITAPGWKVFRKILEPTGRHGKPVLIDATHMQPESRYEYYTYLKEPDNTYKHPVIALTLQMHAYPIFGNSLSIIPIT